MSRAFGQLQNLFYRVAEGERADDAAQAAVDDRRVPQQMYLCKPVADVAKGAKGDAEIWTGEKGAETASGVILEDVFSRTAAVKATDFVYVFYVDGGLEMNKAEC